MSIVKYLNHVSTQVDDAEAAFALFTERLSIPVAWPLTEIEGSRTAGVRIGNVNLEVFEGADGPPLILSFVPTTTDGLAVEIDNRGLQLAEERTWSGPMPDGSTGPMLTTYRLGGNFAGTCAVQLVDFHFDHTQRPPVDGPDRLGVVGVQRARVGAQDAADCIEIWQRLLVPTMFDGTTWQFDEGPSISVEPCGDDELMGLVLEVESVAKASDALEDVGIEEDEAHLRDNGIGLAGVRFYLTD